MTIPAGVPYADFYNERSQWAQETQDPDLKKHYESELETIQANWINMGINPLEFDPTIQKNKIRVAKVDGNEPYFPEKTAVIPPVITDASTQNPPETTEARPPAPISKSTKTPSSLPFSSNPNTVTFTNSTEKTETLVFTPGSGQEQLPPLTIEPGDSVEVTFPPGWNGNIKYSGDEASGHWAQAELNFNAFGGQTFANVSNIFGVGKGDFHITSSKGDLDTGFSEYVGETDSPLELRDANGDGTKEWVKVKNTQGGGILNESAQYLLEQRKLQGAHTYIGTGAGAGDALDPEDQYSTATSGSLNIRLTG